MTSPSHPQAMSAERIVRAACRWGSAVYSVPPPGRHHHVFALEKPSVHTKPGAEEQGFLTSEGRFVDRVEGLFIAQAAGQFNRPDLRPGENPHQLYSEDLW